MKTYPTDFENKIEFIEFYQLKIGDEFKLKGKKYEKISEEYARDLKGRKRFFWPQDTVQLIELMIKEEIWAKYPITEYFY